METTFTVKIYGIDMSGTVTQRGWVPNRATKRALKELEPEKAKKARLRIKAASEEALAEADKAAHEFELPSSVTG